MYNILFRSFRKEKIDIMLKEVKYSLFSSLKKFKLQFTLYNFLTLNMLFEKANAAFKLIIYKNIFLMMFNSFQ